MDTQTIYTQIQWTRYRPTTRTTQYILCHYRYCYAAYCCYFLTNSESWNAAMTTWLSLSTSLKFLGQYCNYVSFMLGRIFNERDFQSQRWTQKRMTITLRFLVYSEAVKSKELFLRFTECSSLLLILWILDWSTFVMPVHISILRAHLRPRPFCAKSEILHSAAFNSGSWFTLIRRSTPVKSSPLGD